MLSAPGDWEEMVEVNPPRLPSMLHSRLRGRWRRVLITDNPFKEVRVSPYAFAARITHDVPDVRPTVVCSTRDRNILAIESEVRGALGNGVDSFLVVQGDMLPEVEHWSNSYEIVEHLRVLQEQIGPGRFEVGMSTRSRQWMFQRRIEVGGQFFMTGPVMDPASVRATAERLQLPMRRRSTWSSRRRSRRSGWSGFRRSAARRWGRPFASAWPPRRRGSSACWAGGSPRPSRRRRARPASRAS